MDGELSQDQIQQRLEALRTPPLPVPAHVAYRYIRPLHESADTYIEYASNPFGRFMLGLPEIDAMIRGFGNGELAYITGRPHSGKTQVVLNAINNNRSKRVIFFTPDEPTELVLAKLVALRTGEGGDVLEQRLRAGDLDAQRLVRSVAREDFSNLLVNDDSLTLGQMHDGVKEAEDYWGEPVDACVIDFLELVLTDDQGTDVVGKSQSVKRFTKDIDRPVICMHQAKRGNRGKPVGMDDMRFGGDMEAIYVLGVWRKRDDDDLDEWERTRQANTVTVGVSKNKRPPSKKGEHDYYLDAATGRIDVIQAELPQVVAKPEIKPMLRIF